MLHAVTQLTKDVLRNIGGALGDEVDTDTLGAYQSYHLLYLIHQRLGRIVKQHMGLIEEKHQTRQLLVANFGQRAVELAHEP